MVCEKSNGEGVKRSPASVLFLDQFDDLNCRLEVLTAMLNAGSVLAREDGADDCEILMVHGATECFELREMVKDCRVIDLSAVCLSLDVLVRSLQGEEVPSNVRDEVLSVLGDVVALCEASQGNPGE